jgi:flagellar hook-associated protein 2
MDVKRVRLDEMKKDVEKTKEASSVWQDIGVKLNKLKDASKELYGFNNPFNEKIAESSNEKVLTAVATREAYESEKKIRVEQVATADRFISKSLDRSFKVEAGVYTFKVGTKEVSFRFGGGSLQDFADAINKNGNGLIQSQVIKDTKNTQVIVIESLKTGSKNRLELSGKSLELALGIGMLERSQSVARTVDFTTTQPGQWEKKLDNAAFKAEGTKLSLEPNAELKVPIQPGISLNKDMVLELDVTVKDLPTPPPEKKGTGPEHPFVGDINFKGVHIENERSEIPIPGKTEPPPNIVNDMQVLFAGNGKNVIPLPQLDPAAKNQRVRIPLGEMTNAVDALLFRNRNTNRAIEVENIRIFDPNAYGEYKPVHPLSTSNDAIVYMDGVKIVRDTNEIGDLIPGVTVSLKEKSGDDVVLKVTRDAQSIKEALVEFVGFYNQLMGQINILTRTNNEVINALTYLTPEERETAKKQMGLLVGDVSLMQLKRNLQTLMMNPYKTGGGDALSLLVQLGVSTNSAGPGTSASLDKNKLLGYLEIDDKKLNEMITNHADWVKDLFGKDTDGDRIVDQGLGFSMDYALRPYSQVGGILATKADIYKRRIDQKNKEISDYNEYLADYEAGLKRKYAAMEGVLNSLDQSSKALDNFSKQANQQ